MKNCITALTLFALSTVGCTPHVGLGSNIGWNDAEPPTIDGIGRGVEYNKQYKTLGPKVFNVKPDQVEMSGSYQERNEEKNRKYKAGASATIMKATASANVDVNSTEIYSSSDWNIIQLKDFSRVPTDKEFVYKCLTVSKFSFESSQKNSATAKLDAGQLANKLGVTAASVEVSANPDKPNTQKVVVNNPNICLAFLSAKLERAGWWFNRTNNPRNFTYERKRVENYNLEAGGVGAIVEPDFGRRATLTKPLYRLYSEVKNGKTLLFVEIQDRDTFQVVPPVLIEGSSAGVWSRRQFVHNYQVQDDILSPISVEVSAKMVSKGVVHIESAKLFSPEYKITRQ